jgi:hypothetical protein
MSREYKYRVNFGNGQVHYPGNKRACLQYIAQYGDGWSFVEWQDPETGDWFKTGLSVEFPR